MTRVTIPVPFDAETVVVSASTDHVFTKYVDAIYVGGDGNLTVKFRCGTQVTYAVTAGQTVFGDFERVVGATTTATLLIGEVSNPDRR